MIGTTLDGKYRILREIGHGGMGAVLEAQSLADGRRVAVKVIRSPDVARNQVLVSRFQREAKLAGSIDTEHIARVYDVGTDPATELPYMAMELLAGEDANQLVRRLGPLPPDLALRMASQTCAGLAKAHAARIVHRDIKSANLFLAVPFDPTVSHAPSTGGGEVQVKILDFGVAKITRGDNDIGETAGLTRTGSVLGSPLFMSPEQARGVKQVDARADLWSLGVVLYHLLSGRAPYQEIDALGELILQLCAGPPPPVQKFAPWVSPAIAAIIDRALRVDPADRYPDADTMRADILRLLDPRAVRDPDSAHVPDAIEVAMLRPLDASARASVAQPFSNSAAPQVSRSAAPPNVMPHASTDVMPSRLPALEPVIQRTESVAHTHHEMSRSAPIRVPRSRSRALVAWFVGGGLIVCALAYAWSLRGSASGPIDASPQLVPTLGAPMSAAAAPTARSDEPPAVVDAATAVPTSSTQPTASARASAPNATPPATGRPRTRKPSGDPDEFGDRK